jgi:myosin heavy subunit
MTNNTSSSSKKQQTTAIAAVIAVVLLALCTFLLVRNYNLSKENQQLTANYDESEQLKADLEQQYYEALSELEGMRGSNEELNALIEQQKEELTAQKERIDGLIANKSQLKKARAELGKLRGQVDQYVAEINQLRGEIEELSSENMQLTEMNQSLNSNLENEKMTTAELSSQRAVLVSEKEELQNKTKTLSKKVNLASVIKVNNIEANGIKIRSNGKAVSKSYAKNVEQLRVCFDTTPNSVADVGNEIYHIRIINPSGETIAIDNLGSGVFTNAASGDELRYTVAKEFEYDQEASSMCANWAPQQAFAEGTYEVEIYNKGYLAGSTSFRLK